MGNDHAGLDELLQYASDGDRICPQPVKWDELWRLLGCPQHVGPPLILAGWAFSSDRNKRERLRAHLAYAAQSGLLDQADSFIRGLQPDDWHTCLDGDLDWNYGDALIEEEEQKKAAKQTGAQHYRNLLNLSDSPAFTQAQFGQTLFLYYLLFGDSIDARAASIRQDVDLFNSLTGEEFSLFDDETPSDVVAAMKEVNRAKRIELLMLEILLCMRSTMDLDRDAVYEFVEDMCNAE